MMDAVGIIPRDVASVLVEAAKIAGATVLHSKQINLPCALSKPSSPPGGTAVVLLDESHISMHWYDQEDGRAMIALDMFTCGLAEPEKATEYLREVLSLDVLAEDTKSRFSCVPISIA